MSEPKTYEPDEIPPPGDIANRIDDLAESEPALVKAEEQDEAAHRDGDQQAGPGTEHEAEGWRANSPSKP